MNCKCKLSQNVYNGVCGKCLLPLPGAVHSEDGTLLKISFQKSKKPKK
jgi:hypothetical protein